MATHTLSAGNLVALAGSTWRFATSAGSDFQEAELQDGQRIDWYYGTGYTEDSPGDPKPVSRWIPAGSGAQSDPIRFELAAPYSVVAMLTRSTPTTVAFDPGGPIALGGPNGEDPENDENAGDIGRSELLERFGNGELELRKATFPGPGGMESAIAGDLGGGTTAPSLELDPGLVGPGTGGFTRDEEEAPPPALPEGVFVAADRPETRGCTVYPGKVEITHAPEVIAYASGGFLPFRVRFLGLGSKVRVMDRIGYEILLPKASTVTSTRRFVKCKEPDPDLVEGAQENGDHHAYVAYIDPDKLPGPTVAERSITKDVTFRSRVNARPMGEPAAKAVRLQAVSAKVRYYVGGQLPIQHFRKDSAFRRHSMAGSPDRVGSARFYFGYEKSGKVFRAEEYSGSFSRGEQVGTTAVTRNAAGAGDGVVVFTESSLPGGDDANLSIYARIRIGPKLGGAIEKRLNYVLVTLLVNRVILPTEGTILSLFGKEPRPKSLNSFEAEGARRAALVLPYYRLDRQHVPNCLAGRARCLMGGGDGHFTARVNNDRPQAAYTILGLEEEGTLAADYAGLLSGASTTFLPLLKAGSKAVPVLGVVSGLAGVIWAITPPRGKFPNTAAEANVTSDFEIIPFEGEKRSTNTVLRKSVSCKAQNTPRGQIDVGYGLPPLSVKVGQGMNVFQMINLALGCITFLPVDLLVEFSHEGYTKALEVAAE